MFNGDISTDVFLSDYWQKKPLVIRNAIPNFESPLNANELAGLACESTSNSRLIKQLDKKPFWSIEYGPFDEELFSELPKKNWTLLVSDIEKHITEGRDLLGRFRFIPDWRIDDLMISYAVEGGTVGPHTDAYDVFLLQAEGQRRWQINNTPCEETTNLIEGIDLRILKQFEADKEWILEPGDILYLPPNIPHYGVALNDCMTCSIGFRAPSTHALVSEYAESIAANLSENHRYSDSNLNQQTHPAEITNKTLGEIKNILNNNLVINDENIKKWFGEFITSSGTENNNDLIDNVSAHTNLDFLNTTHAIYYSMHAKFLFTKNEDNAFIFVDGNSYPSSLKFAQFLCNSYKMSPKDLMSICANPKDQETLLNLFNDGYLFCE